MVTVKARVLSVATAQQSPSSWSIFTAKLTDSSSAVMTQSLISSINSDLPISSKAEDVFSFTPVVDEVITHLFSNSLPESLVVGLSGKWGSGKTSFLNLIDEQLTNFKIGEKHIITMRYVPWRVEDRKSMLSNFLPLLTEKIEDSQTSSREDSEFSKLFRPVKNYVRALENLEPSLSVAAKVLSALGMPILEKGLEILTDAKSTLNEEKTPDIEELHRSAYVALSELQIPIVVMIDDIDRLEPYEIVDLLRLVRATAQLPYVTFILSYDQVHVMKAVQEVLKVDGQEFLEKFVQLPIAIPYADQQKLKEIVEDKLVVLLDGTKESNSSSNYVIENMEAVLTNIEETGALNTPRDVFRILNTITYKLNSITKTLTEENTIYHSVIQTKFPFIFEALNKSIEQKKNNHKDFKNRNTNNPLDLDKFINPDLSEYKAIKDIIDKIISS